MKVLHKLCTLLFLVSLSIFSNNIKSPAEFLGYEIGERFTRHHKVIDYFKYVSDKLTNVKLEKYGETNEHRSLYIGIISSEENIKNIDEIRRSNTSQMSGASNNNTNKKAIVWLSYNVHGNEASSSEAAMLTLFELATSQKHLLKNTVVIIDPSSNPDGRDRYVNWYHQVKSTPYNTDINGKEHHEPWPSGRPNHYLFDLNRDWAWATQVETKHRIAVYNKWMPHIHVDFHEQYMNNPYYFAPAAAPYHTNITKWQRDFQVAIGNNNAMYFDKKGWLYFTKERFDLFYPSYGDTYPSFMGAIGLTYEQAGHSLAGLGVKTDENEILTLKDRAYHHLTSGLSTVEIANNNAEKLNIEFTRFFKNDALTYKSFVLKNDNQDKINRLKALLDIHEITYEVAKNGSVKGYDYSTQQNDKMFVSQSDLVIHTDQPKGKMVHVLFEPKAAIVDSLTYDITAWSLPYAYGFKAIASKNKVASTKNKATNKPIINEINTNAYAYISKWNSVKDARFLADLLQNNIVPRYSEKAFNTAGKFYEKGSLILLRNDNKNNDFDARLIEIANKHQRKLNVVTSGLVSEGADFGSPYVKPIKQQQILVLSGDETNSLNFGEIWHFFEKELQYPITILQTKDLPEVELFKYDVIILPSGYYSHIVHKKVLENLKKWVSNGGTIVAMGNALSLFADTNGFALREKSNEQNASSSLMIPYDKRERKSVEKMITGSIFKSNVDTSHPLAFGYENYYFSLKVGAKNYHYLENGYNVAYFSEDTKNVSGFAGKEAVKNVPKSLLFGVDTIGNGSVVYMTNNPLFRAFWENGKLIVANAVFFLNSDRL